MAPRGGMTRRTACGLLASGLASGAVGAASEPFRLRYVLAACMYGKMKLEVVLPEVERTGADVIDIWGLPHGDHREQIDAMGVEAAGAAFRKHGVKVGVFSRYPLGPFGLREEMKVVRRFGGSVIVCGTTGPKEPKGAAARTAVAQFLERMKPHAEAAEEHGVTIALENHDRQLLYTPDAIRAFAELNRSRALGVAFAPHHLHRWVDEMPKLIRDLGKDQLAFFYAQEHGMGTRKKLPREQEMMQMPGFGGGLDYRPIVAALREVGYRGWVEIFMHPVPRGIPILPTVGEITGAINRSRAYLEKCLKESG